MNKFRAAMAKDFRMRKSLAVKAKAAKINPADKKTENGGDDEGGRDTGELTSWPKGRAVSDPDRMSKPLMLVKFGGRSAAVFLNRRSTTAGLIHIRFDDGGGDQEVDAGVCKSNLLTEAYEVSALEVI